MKNYLIKIIFFALLSICSVEQVYPQSHVNDSIYHPYHVNYWITGTICGAGIAANLIGIPGVKNKPDITTLEFQALNKDDLNGFDRWAVNQDPFQMDKYNQYANTTLTSIIVLPALLLFDKQIRHDWIDILLMYVEATFITSNFFNYSFLGPSFQNRLRPMAYYKDQLGDKVITGNNRNSFYSGHAASAAVATFFMAKVYSDYNPSIGDNKYLLYAAAAVPPLIVGYLRVKGLNHFPSDVMVGLGVGALCGIIIPEFHRIQGKNISLGLYSSEGATGITMKWQPDFLK